MQTLRKYHNRAIKTAQVIEELIKMVKYMEIDLAEAEKLGLNSDKIAFYRAWQKRDSVRARLRNLVCRALCRWKYPPDISDEAIDLCLQ
jgi:type I restriction enzyme R subunit